MPRVAAAERYPAGLGLKNISLWVLQLAVAATFFKAAVPKLTGAEMMVHMFAAIGFGQWLRYLTGSLEVIGAAALLIPALSGLGALLLIVVMAGAVLTHLIILGGSPALAAILLIASAIIAWGRRERMVETWRRF